MNNKLNILYEDNHIIVVVKEQNVLSQGDSTGDNNLLDMLKEYIKVKYKKPGNVYLGLVHRLDRPVGGVMVFARSSKAASRLSESIKKHDGFRKKYLVVVRGLLDKKEGVFEDYLLKKEDGNTIISDKEHGKKAVLKYKVLEENDGMSLVQVELVTGRHHQIRVQFSSRGHSIYGDARYGVNTGDDICLWAYSLEFVHPTKKELMLFSSKPNNKKNGWNKFNLNSIKNS